MICQPEDHSERVFFSGAPRGAHAHPHPPEVAQSMLGLLRGLLGLQDTFKRTNRTNSAESVSC